MLFLDHDRITFPLMAESLLKIYFLGSHSEITFNVATNALYITGNKYQKVLKCILLQVVL